MMARRLLVDWAESSRAALGESTLGDMCLVEQSHEGVLVALADGLGHGEHAAAAARRSIVILRRSPGDNILSLIEECHEHLRGSRGVVMSLASINAEDGTMTWAGVGNVEARLFHRCEDGGYTRESLMLRAGVVGYRMPGLRSSTVTVSPGDVIILASDGVSNGFEEGLNLDEPVKLIAENILAEKGKLTDDVLVLVVRFLGNLLPDVNKSGGPST